MDKEAIQNIKPRLPMLLVLLADMIRSIVHAIPPVIKDDLVLAGSLAFPRAATFGPFRNYLRSVTPHVVNYDSSPLPSCGRENGASSREAAL